MEESKMPLTGKGSYFTLTLYNCRQWVNATTLIETIQQLQDTFSLVVMHRQPVKGGGSLLTPIRREELVPYLERKYEKNKEFLTTHPFSSLIGEMSLDLQFPSTEQLPPYIAMSATESRRTNSISFMTLLNRRTNPKPELTLKYAEKIIQLYVLIAQLLIKTLEPDYGWIAEDDEYTDHLKVEDILTRRPINVLYWANYFSTTYLDESTRGLVLQAPVGIVQHLEAGIWYQLHEAFEHVERDQVVSIEKQVMTHFHTLNLERIQWKFESG